VLHVIGRRTIRNFYNRHSRTALASDFNLTSKSYAEVLPQCLGKKQLMRKMRDNQGGWMAVSRRADT
jgi:hypothetical protein